MQKQLYMMAPRLRTNDLGATTHLHPEHIQDLVYFEIWS